MKSLSKILFVTALTLFSCNEEESNPGNDFGSPEDLPASILGTVENMELSTSATTDHPYMLDQRVNFIFSSSGALFIDIDPDATNGEEIEIMNFSISGNEFIWTDSDAGFQYALSLNGEEINEINLNSEDGNTFHGQFIPISTSSELDLIKAFAGTYTITSVDEGSHTRMTVIVDANGNIHFDTGTSFTTDAYELITDRRDCCDGIWIDLNPYPTEPYERLELYVNASDELVEIHYYPQYPNVSGRTKVKF